MDLKEIQEKIVKFAKKRIESKDIKITPDISFIHLTEEVGEIARQLFNKKMRPEAYDENNLKEEIADVILETLVLADTLDMKVDNLLEERIRALNKRLGFEDE